METNRYRYTVDRKDIMYLRATIESYDGMAVVRTVGPAEAVIELQIAPGCEAQITELIHHMQSRENLAISGMDG
jgi:hypothetical protein